MTLVFQNHPQTQTGQTYYHLVESYWDNGTSRQRTLMSLGRAGKDRMDEVISAIGKHNVVGHLTMCFLAYLCESLMTKALREKNIMLDSRAIEEEIIEPRTLTVVEAMREWAAPEP